MGELYIMGYPNAYLRILSARTVANSCGHVAAYLSTALRVLDIGCGPGSISVGLAHAVAPGELHGIDIEPSQVETAASLAGERGLSNAEFTVADVLDMPFEDGSFDVVHCNDVLAYVPEINSALGEINRVLKPGGVLACREIIMDSFFIHPDTTGLLNRGYAVFADVLAADDGHPNMGKDIGGLMLQAGFADIRVSGSFETFAKPGNLDLFYDLGQGWFFTSQVNLPAQQYGAATDSMLQEMMAARDAWYESPGAMAAFAFGEAVALKP